MLQEWKIVEARRDSSHEFAGGSVNCTVCGKPRWHHALDGFKPSQTVSQLSDYPQAAYRGPHPFWSRPGSFSRVERAELEALQREERRRIEEAIHKDQAQFKRRQDVG